MHNTLKKQHILLLNIFLVSAYVSLNSFKPFSDTVKTPSRFKTIVIDAGHGGKDPGARGSYSFEKNVTLAIAKKLKSALAEDMPGIKIVMTRTNDTFIELNKRSVIANESHGDLFVSIHCNSSPAGTGERQKGVMLLVYGLHRVKEQLEAIRENSSIYIEKDYKTTYASYDENDPANRIIMNLYMQKYRKQGILFADLLNSEFKVTDNRPSIGVKEQGVLVLAHSAMPAVLVETGYINNAKEEDYLNSDAGQDEIVQAIVNAIKKYKKEVYN